MRQEGDLRNRTGPNKHDERPSSMRPLMPLTTIELPKRFLKALMGTGTPCVPLIPLHTRTRLGPQFGAAGRMPSVGRESRPIANKMLIKFFDSRAKPVNC